MSYDPYERRGRDCKRGPYVHGCRSEIARGRDPARRRAPDHTKPAVHRGGRRVTARGSRRGRPAASALPLRACGSPPPPRCALAALAISASPRP